MWMCVRWEWRRQTRLLRLWASLGAIMALGFMFTYIYWRIRGESALQVFIGQELANSFFVPVFAVAVSSSVLLPFFVTLLSGDAISGERQLGTWAMLLSQGVRPWRLYLGKWLIAMLYAWLSTALLIGASTAGGILLFGWHQAILPAGTRASSLDLIRLLIVLLGYCGAGQMAVASLALSVSAFCRHTLSTVMIVMGSLLLMALIGDFPVVPRVQQFLLTQYFSRAADVLSFPVNWSGLERGLLVYSLYIILSWGLVFWLDPLRQ